MRLSLILALVFAAPSFASSPDAEAAAAFAFAKAARERPVVKVAALRTGYPLRGSLWSGCPNWQHLDTGEHRGKFDRAWLASLTPSEVQALHSDDHEGRVNWQYAVRPPSKPSPEVAKTFKSNVNPPEISISHPVTFSLPASMSSCPGGNCPAQSQSQRVGLFGRWR